MMGHRMRTESLAKDVGSLVTDFAASRVSHELIDQNNGSSGRNYSVRVLVSNSILTGSMAVIPGNVCRG